MNLWLKQFAKKTFSLRSWVEATRKGNLLQEERDLSDLFHPEVILNALKQKVSRETKVPIDQLVIKVAFGGGFDELSIKVKNVILEGCIFKNGVLTEGDNPQEYINLPPMRISFGNNQ